MNHLDTEEPDDERACEPGDPAGEPAQAAPLTLSQAELSVMHPAADDPDWRYFFGALHS